MAPGPPENTRDPDSARRGADRRPPALPRGLETTRLRCGRVNWQVFGLTGGPTRRRRSTGRRFPDSRPVLHDGGRSRSPLRGSPGLAPGSLLRRTPMAWTSEPAREHNTWQFGRDRTPHVVSACRGRLSSPARSCRGRGGVSLSSCAAAASASGNVAATGTRSRPCAASVTAVARPCTASGSAAASTAAPVSSAGAPCDMCTPWAAAVKSAIVTTRAGVAGDGDQVGQRPAGAVEHRVHSGRCQRADPFGEPRPVRRRLRAEGAQEVVVVLARRADDAWRRGRPRAGRRRCPPRRPRPARARCARRRPRAGPGPGWPSRRCPRRRPPPPSSTRPAWAPRRRGPRSRRWRRARPWWSCRTPRRRRPRP